MWVISLSYYLVVLVCIQGMVVWCGVSGMGCPGTGDCAVMSLGEKKKWGVLQLLLYHSRVTAGLASGQWSPWPTRLVSFTPKILKLDPQWVWLLAQEEIISLSAMPVNLRFHIHPLHLHLHHTWMITTDLWLVFFSSQFISPIITNMVHPPWRSCLLGEVWKDQQWFAVVYLSIAWPTEAVHSWWVCLCHWAT